VRILYVTTVLPSKQRTGGEIASQMFIHTLSELGHTVKVMGYARQDDVYQNQAHETVVGQRFIETSKAGLHVVSWFARALLQGLPYSAAKYYSRRYVEQLQELQSQVDLVILEHSQLGWLLPHLPNRFIFNTQNLEHELYSQHAASASGIKKWILHREARLIKTMEDALTQQAQQVWTLTRHDTHYFSTHPQVLTLGIPSAIASGDKPSARVILG
jgi:polysaccharide biosynthesis protein PslH